MKSIIKLLLLLIGILTILNAKQIDLTDQEKEWINNNSTLYIYNHPKLPPNTFFENNEFKGYWIDLLNHMFDKVNIKIVHKIRDREKISYEKLVNQSNLNILPSLLKTKKREESMLFSKAITQVSYPAIIMRSDAKPIRDIKSLEGKRIALVQNHPFDRVLKKSGINFTPVYIKEYPEDLEAVSYGTADVALNSIEVFSYWIKKRQIKNIIPTGAAKFPSMKNLVTAFAVEKNNIILQSIINKLYKSLDKSIIYQLQEKWFFHTQDFNYLQETLTIELTKEEKSFIKSNPIIKVHNERDWPPYNYSRNDKPLGYSIDIMNLIAKKTGMNIEYVTGPTWNEFLVMMKKKSLDVMLNIVKTPQREKYLLYTPSYADNPNAIVSRKDEPYKSIESLFGKTVAIPQGFFTEEVLRKSYPQIKLFLVKNLLESMKAVTFGKADAALGELAVINYLINENMMTNLAISGEAKMGEPGVSLLNIATRKDLPLLHSILTKGVASITVEEKNYLQQKWLGEVIIKEDNKVLLNSEEKTYLSKQTNIKMCVDPDWLPFEKIDKDGLYKGMASDIIKIVSKKINKPIVLVPTKSWKETMKFFKDKKCDILPSVVATSDRLKNMNFTKPYMKKPLVVVTNEEQFFIQDSSELVNKKIGVISEYGFINLLKQKQPNVNIVTVKSIKEGLQKVQNKEFFGFVDALPSIAYVIQRDGIFDLKIAGRLEFDVELSIASQNSEPLLNSIMQKALDDIEQEQIDSIIGKWISIKVEQSFDYRILMYVVAVFLVILAFITYRHITIQNMNKKLEKISITDALTQIYNRRYFNEILPKIINSAKRKNELVTFVIMDIDHFKQYNDTYGHQMGDEVLTKVASAIKDSLDRADDYCFRLGGEEFGVIFKTDSKEKAEQFANKIRKNIENLHIQHTGNSASKYITASMGLICKEANSIKDSEEIYKQGDDLLYKAKESGRNRVEC